MKEGTKIENEPTVPLKDYIDTHISFILEKFKDAENSINYRFEDRERALQTAYAQMEKRLDGMNEFRGQLKDQNQTFMTRREVEACLDKIEIQLEELKKNNVSLANIQAKLWIIITIGGALAIMLITHMSGKI